MNATLLRLRLLLQQSTVEAVGVPMLFVESLRVAALWTCGCVAAGPSFDVLAFVGCRIHRHEIAAPLERRVSECRPARIPRVGESKKGLSS